MMIRADDDDEQGMITSDERVRWANVRMRMNIITLCDALSLSPSNFPFPPLAFSFLTLTSQKAELEKRSNKFVTLF